VRGKFVDRLLFVDPIPGLDRRDEDIDNAWLRAGVVISTSQVRRFLRLQSYPLIELPGIHHGLGHLDALCQQIVLARRCLHLFLDLGRTGRSLLSQ